MIPAVVNRGYRKNESWIAHLTLRFAPCGETSFVPRSPRSALSSASARSSPWLGLARARKLRWKRRLPVWEQNVIVISSGSTTSSGIRTGWGGAGTLKIEDAEAIRREVPSVTAVSEEVPSTAQIAAGNQNWFTRVMGESPDYFDIRQWPLAEGAPFTAQDVRSANKVCVIGQTTATQVFGNDDPVGQTLRIKNVPFIVSGVLTPKGLSIQGTDQDDVVVMPLYQRDEARRGRHDVAQH